MSGCLDPPKDQTKYNFSLSVKVAPPSEVLSRKAYCFRPFIKFSVISEFGSGFHIGVLSKTITLFPVKSVIFADRTYGWEEFISGNKNLLFLVTLEYPFTDPSGLSKVLSSSPAAEWDQYLPQKVLATWSSKS